MHVSIDIYACIYRYLCMHTQESIDGFPSLQTWLSRHLSIQYVCIAIVLYLLVSSRIPILVVLEFSRETGCSVPRQDLCGLLYTTYSLSFSHFKKQSVCWSPSYILVSKHKRTSGVYSCKDSHNVFPSFPEGMWFELSLDKVFPVLFYRSKHIFAMYFSYLWHTLATFVVHPNIGKVASFAKHT